MLMLRDRLPFQLWQLSVSFLPFRHVLKLPPVCRWMNDKVVWCSKSSGRLMWGEMPSDRLNEGIKWVPWHPDRHKKSLLEMASYGHASAKQLTILITGGARVTGRCLANAWCHFDMDTVRFMLEAKADPNFSWRHGPLIVNAVYLGKPEQRLERTRLLVEYGANVNAVSSLGCTVLMFACRRTDNDDVIRLLIASNADVNISRNDGRTVIQTNQDPNYVSILLEAAM